MRHSNKLIRFLQAFKKAEGGRRGKCTPEECETLEGVRGAACCRFDFKCPGLKKDLKCKIHKIRPINCRTFPRTREDLKLVRGCGFYWDEKS